MQYQCAKGYSPLLRRLRQRVRQVRRRRYRQGSWQDRPPRHLRWLHREF